MHQQQMTCALLAAGMLAGSVAAEAARTRELRTSTRTTRTTVVTETEQLVREKTPWKPIKVCVLDFTSLDIEGQKRFLDGRNKPITVPPQCTLNDADRKSVNGVMQGFVRMIDAWDNTRTGRANRTAQREDNAFERAKALKLYRTIVNGQARPMVIGAAYLTAYLGRHNDVFGCVDTAQMTAAMNKLSQAPDFPRDFMLRLARETGATHLIYGTVSDMRTRVNSFKGYGIETKTTNYQLDVIVKVVDLVAQHAVYSNVYTGNYREQRPISGTQFDNNIFQNLMTSALEQAAEDLYDCAKPGPKNKIAPTPMPYRVTVAPQGGVFFKAASAEVFIDGTHAGPGGGTFTLPEGRHTIEVKAPGYRDKRFDLEVSADAKLDFKLEKK